MSSLLIRGGTIVDGTGAPPYRGDLRVRCGRIAEIGANLTPQGERQIDAGGALVTPGFIDCHTHVDGSMWWAPDLHPMPAFGVTTAVMGHCGVTVAPLPPEGAGGVLDLFCFLEDLPRVAFDAVPFGWATSWSAYRKAAQAHPTAVSLEGFAGHISLRVSVMGEAAWERRATAAERARMAELLDEAMAGSALGLSTNLMDKDRDQRPVPSALACDAEFEALADVLARYPGAILQINAHQGDPALLVEDVERMVRIAAPRGVRGLWSTLATQVAAEPARRAGERLHEGLVAGGIDFWPQFVAKPFELVHNFESSIMFHQIPAWHELVQAPRAAKAAMLRDPEWRRRARHELDTFSGPFGYDFIRQPERMMLGPSETGAGPIDVTLAAYASTRGIAHPSDALADWLLANGSGSMMRPIPNLLDEALTLRLLRDPQTFGFPNDSGAHLQLFETTGQTLYLFTHWVRDTGQLAIEEAVHIVTGKHAAFFGLADRGVLAPGMAADINVFALDELAMHPVEKSFDVPGGSWRLLRKPAGLRATIARGEPTFLAGTAAPARPGVKFVRRDTDRS